VSSTARLLPAVLVALLLLGSVGLGGAESVAAEPVRFRLHADESRITFKATSLLMNADGRFHRFRGEIVVDPQDLSKARVSLTVEAASIDTGIVKRDNHLRSEDFFHVERYPTVSFTSTAIDPRGREVLVTGRLTIRGVSREIVVPVTVDVTREAVVASGQFEIDRNDYAIRYNSVINPVGAIVKIAFNVKAQPA
jgi:polyisoprenoid-binding protein YceI